MTQPDPALPPTLQPAQSPSHAFINGLLELADADDLEIGAQVEVEPKKGPKVWGELVRIRGRGVAEVRWTEGGQTHTYQSKEEDWVSVIDSPKLRALWEREQKEAAPDGVAWSDTSLSPPLRERLIAGFEALLASEPPDYHPGSGTIVRDLVHPSLYCYVEGRTALRPGATHPAAGEPPDYDLWGRPYEGSRYQWLPTPFHVAEDGSVEIEGQINNLDRARHGALYGDLAALFSAALPQLESVYGYTRAHPLLTLREQDCEADLPEPRATVKRARPPSPLSLRGRTLQVITKIVEYNLSAGQEFEGVWHVEGMSHEHILATSVTVLDRDEALLGGEIRFQRPYTREEAGQLFWNVAQCRKRTADELVERGVIPIGSLDTPRGRQFVFPNGHIHKLAKMHVAPGAERARRRVIVFWLVDPDTRILSTAEVAPQQGVMSRGEAEAHRGSLMEERRLHKQSMNVRTVSLCEH